MSNVPVWEKYVMWAMLVAGFIVNIVIIAMAANAKSSLDTLVNTVCPEVTSLPSTGNSQRRLSEPMSDTNIFCGTLEFAYVLYGTALSTVIGSQIAILIVILFSAVYWTFIYRKLMRSQGYMVEGIDVNRVAQLLAIVAMAVGYLLQFVVFGMLAGFESSAKFSTMKSLTTYKVMITSLTDNAGEGSTSEPQFSTYFAELDQIDDACSTIYALVITLVVLKTLQLVLGHGWAVSMTKQD
jgi:hypothetical protein